MEFAYFEKWIPETSSQKRWMLQQAYLTVFLVDDITRLAHEILCVHCDPNESSPYQRGPHLHVSQAPEPIPHCHFSLCLVNFTLDSVSALNTAFREVSELLRKEVLMVYED